MLYDKNGQLIVKDGFGYEFEKELARAPMLSALLSASPLAFNIWNKDMLNIMCNRYVLNIFNIIDGNEYIENFYKFSPEIQPNGISSIEMSRLNFEKAMNEGKNIFNWMHLTQQGEELPAEITLIKIDENSFVGFVRDLRPVFSDVTDISYDYYFTDKVPHNILIQEISNMTEEWFFSLDIRTGNYHYYGKIWLNGFEGRSYASEKRILELEFVHKDDIGIFKEIVSDFKAGINRPYEMRFKNDDGEYRYYFLNYKIVTDVEGLPIFVIGKASDINEKKLLEESAMRDALTNCYNKMRAEKVINEKLYKKDGETSALFVMDIDNFKGINDNFGHFFGDEVLREISSGLKSAFDIDIIARVGGDEFIVFIEDASDNSIIEQTALKILEIYKKSYSINGKEYNISGSVGISVFPKDGDSYQELYHNADKALNQAKSEGKNRYERFDKELNIGTIRNTTKIDNANKIASGYFDYELISTVFELLYEKNGSSSAINSALMYLCQKYEADRSYIFESLDGGESYDNTFEFCKEGISSEIEGLQGIAKDAFVDFISKAHNDIIYSNNLRDTLELDFAFETMANQGIMSFVHAQIKNDGVMTFFIGLDDCTKTRVWTEREINSLQYIGKLISIILQGKHLREEVDKLAETNKNSTHILNSSEDIVYVSDIETYDLLYLNQSTKKLIGLSSDDEWLGKKCYKILQGKDAPCEFCTNHLLSLDSYHEWSYFNPMLGKYFLLKDMLIPFEGRNARLEIATDISIVTKLESELQDKLIDEQFLSSCVELLHSGMEPDVSINMILDAIAKFYDADRSFIFEISDCREFISNTYEFNNKNLIGYKDKMQNLPIETLSYLFRKLEKDSAFYHKLEEVSVKEGTRKREIVDMQKLSSILISTIWMQNGETTGFVGVDNPKANIEKIDTISSVAKFIASFLEQTKLIEKLNNLSYYDILTGSKNRHSYNLELKEIDKKHIDSLGVVYVDIKKLSVINDTKGVLFGDKILNRLSTLLREQFGDSVYRVGGDEFVVLRENISENDFEDSISVLQSRIDEEKDFKASIGYTWNKNFDSLHSINDKLYEGEKYTRILAKNLEMEIANDKFVVFLQPQMTLATNRVESAEALIRRYDANGVLQAPYVFIPFYEKEGIISMIDKFVLETVCKALKGWRDLGCEKIEAISVNCSRMTIAEKGIVEQFSEICNRYDIDHSQIVVEITETINGISENVLAKIIEDFTIAGFSVSLDDFGCGYSNLTSLVVSDFDEIKVDMRIINDIETDAKSKALTEVAISLCSKLNNIISVAEGVENINQCNILREMGCIKGQGYYFDKPMTIDEFEQKFIKDCI